MFRLPLVTLILTSFLNAHSPAEEKPAAAPQAALVPAALQALAVPDAQGVVRLPASTAEIIGTTLRYEPQPHKNTLGFWTRPEDQAAWNFELPAAGKYKITLLQGCGNGSGGSLVHVIAGRDTLPFTVKETGGFQAFVPLDLGPVDLPAGRQRIVIAPQSKPGPAVMDVRLVTLTPVKTEAEAAKKDAKPVGFAKWEEEISKIEARLKAHPPAPGGIVFAGSSSIRLWKLEEAFPGLPVVNCGFGGSVVADSTHFAPRLIFPLKPRLVVFYAGDNDSANGLSAGRIATDFTAFADAVHTALPDCRILYIPIKPSISRVKLRPLQSEANALIKAHCESRPATLEYIDLATPLLTAEGGTQPRLYQKDGLHLSPAGYGIWNQLLRPKLEAALAGAK
ncbi:MAG: GDSL-type esterase/lipase family protein [Verrucomicrobiota bacterium]